MLKGVIICGARTGGGQGGLYNGGGGVAGSGSTAAAAPQRAAQPSNLYRAPLPAHLQGTGGGRDHAQAHVAARYDGQGAPYFGGVHGGYGHRRLSLAGTSVAGGEAIAVEALVVRKCECPPRCL